MYYLLTCECGRKFSVSRKQAGQELTCECGRTLDVPALRGFAALPTTTENPAAGDQQTVSRAERARSVWSGWRGPAIALAAAIFVVSGFATARFVYHRASLDTGYTAEVEIAAGNELFDKSSPEDLSLMWNDYQKLRLSVKDRPMFYRVALFARDREISAAISGTVCLLSGMAVCAIWLSARRRKSA